ncbi:WAP-type 'four-disulfide core [Trichuris suis]|nr:WAP-type 'four-disulfide core [Trichuris suis]
MISCIITVVAASNMHNGNCPPDAHYEEIIKTECDDDSMCEMDQRCCPVKDTMKCVATVNYVADVSRFKDGECPHVSEEMRKNATDCKVHQDCPAKDFCCQAKCVLPLPRRPTPHEGFCPIAVRMPIIESTCQHDSDCEKEKKCCHKLEKISCVRAVYHANDVRKPGHCPAIEDDEKVSALKLCNGDDDCFSAEKCCPTTITLRCFSPQHRPAPPKPGYCVHSNVFPVKLMPLCHTDYDCIGDRKCCWASGVMDCTYPTDNVTFQLKASDKVYEMSLHSSQSRGNESTSENVVVISTNRNSDWY